MAKLDDLETRKGRIDQLLTQLRTLQSAGKCLCMCAIIQLCT